MSLMALFFTIVVALVIQPVAAEEPDWNDYRNVLQHIKPGLKNGVKLTQVDYAALKGDGSQEKTYRNLSAFDINHLIGKDERLAFYINAYNILALKMVTDNWPTDSIKDVGSLFSPVWNKSAGRLGGNTVTLGDVEHQILRKMSEPRIHLAIVCASVSCPDLRPEPYTAARLNEQLDDQSRQFLHNLGKGLRIEGSVIQVSKIFDWFEDDFEVYGGVESFIRRYRPELPKLNIKSNISYDWSVNGQ